MGAKNYCKDKRDQAMRDLIEQASPLLFPGGFPQSIMNNSINTILQNGIQPTNGKPYYVGGKKGGSHFKGEFNYKKYVIY